MEAVDERKGNAYDNGKEVELSKILRSKKSHFYWLNVRAVLQPVHTSHSRNTTLPKKSGFAKTPSYSAQ